MKNNTNQETGTQVSLSAQRAIMTTDGTLFQQHKLVLRARATPHGPALSNKGNQKGM